MARTLKDNLAAHAAIFTNTQHFGDACSYLPSTGSAVAFNGVFDEDDRDAEAGREQRDQHGDRDIRKAVLEVPATVAVELDGKFSINGDTWSILGHIGSDAGFNTFEIQLPRYKKINKPKSNR